MKLQGGCNFYPAATGVKDFSDRGGGGETACATFTYKVYDRSGYATLLVAHDVTKTSTFFTLGEL